MHLAHGSEHVLRPQRLALRRAVELVREHIEQHFRVALGVDVPMVGVEQLGAQRGRVRQVAVVRQHDAERRVHIKRLRFVLVERVAGGGIAHLADAAFAWQCAHVARAKHVAHHAARLVHVKLALLLGHDAGRVLAAVLQQQQRIVEQLIDRGLGNDADDSAHENGFLREISNNGPDSAYRLGFGVFKRCSAKTPAAATA